MKKKATKPVKKVEKKDTLSCERCGHFLSMHNDRRGCGVQWCNCRWRRP